MDILFIIVMFVVVTIIDNLANRKKPRIPPQTPPEFDIPELANDPNLTVEIRPHEVQPNVPTRPKKISTPEVQNELPELNIELTPSNVMNAFVMSELLDKPKALRRRRR